MITTINEFKRINESNDSGYVHILGPDGDELLYGTFCVTGAEVIDSPGVRVDLKLDNGSYVRISDDDTIYLLINGNAQECRFDGEDTDTLVDYIYSCQGLYDYKAIQQTLVEILERLRLDKIEESYDNLSDDVLLVKDTLEPVDANEWEIDQVVDIISDPQEIMKLESAASNVVTSTNLNYPQVGSDIKVGSTLWLTVMMKPKTDSTAYPMGRLGVIHAKILATFQGTGKLNQLRNSGKI